MNLIPALGWYDTENRNFFQASLAPDPDNLNQPKYKSQINVPMCELKVEILKDSSGRPRGQLPSRSNPTDAGLDIYAAEDITILPNYFPEYRLDDSPDLHRVTVKTGIAVQVPPGLGWFLWDRSSVSAKHGIHRVAGVIDSGYRDEVLVALVNLSNKEYHIKKGDRIAQGILAPIILANPIEVDHLDNVDRGGGFGSTGV